MKAGNIANVRDTGINAFDIEAKIIEAGGDKNLQALTKVWNALAPREQAHREVTALFAEYKKGIKNGK